MGLLILLAVLVLAGLAAGSLMRAGRTRGTQGALPHAAALEVLRERYARGEIDRETYQRMRDDLLG